MSENAPNNETGTEKIPNEREILNQFESIIGNDFEIVRSLEDEQGPYLIEVKILDEVGDPAIYTYQRAGNFNEGSSNETVIDVVYYMGDMPVGGDTVARYKDNTWVKA